MSDPLFVNGGGEPPRFSRGIFLLFSYENSSGGGDMQINGEERTV